MERLRKEPVEIIERMYGREETMEKIETMCARDRERCEREKKRKQDIVRELIYCYDQKQDVLFQKLSIGL